MSDLLCLIQARMNSARLPGKSMLPLAGVPLIEHIVRRCQATSLPMTVCVCTTDTPADDPLAAHIGALSVPVHRGSEDDVLARFYGASLRWPEADVIIRITADDWCKDPALIDYAINAFLHEHAGVTRSVTGPRDLPPPPYLHLGGYTWPVGLDVEVFTREALTLAHQHATTAAEREHVTPWMGDTFGTWQLKNPTGHGNASLRWTLDTPEDVPLAEEVYAALFKHLPVFGFKDMIDAGYCL